ncbi:MAG: hemerythrin HHE cation-binding protein [Candidatus Melainabacteria bacterium HGW-Melainabacteria-1]|nr:MAG: hemerythrin HHE cation-binding protein [Candidatus Melainabacteria bacterium HGW-Melainabacteria-1]
MKRDPGLAELSREHLPALILAYRLRHGRSSNPAEPWPEDPLAQRSETLVMVHGELARHFAAEEQFLIPLQLADPMPAQRVLAEHAQFWQLVSQIEAVSSEAAETLPPLLCALGELLEAHIRFEERVWFEQLQRELAPSVLADLGRQIEVFLAQA